MSPIIQLSPFILLPGIGMILVSIAFIVYAVQRGGVWGYLGLGALAWIVTVAVKFLIAIPFNSSVYRFIYVEGSLFAPGSMLFYLYVGVLTGLTEVLMSWLLLRYTRLGRAPWGKALAFGIGFGAFEALLLGISSLAGTATALAAPQSLPAAALSNIALANNPIYGLAPIAERLGTIFVHVFCGVLLFYGVATGKARWMWLSFAYKSLFDTVAGFAQFWGVESVAKLWTIEGILLVFGLIAWWGIRQIHQKFNTARPTLEAAPVVAPAV